MELKGSDKQIAWAEQIRAKGLADIDATLEEFERLCIQHNSPATEVEQARAEYHALRNKVAAETSAAWWIEHRGMGGRSLLKAVR